MKTKILSILALLLMAVAQSAWAQTVNCLPSDIGKVLGTDGKVYATVSAAGGLDKVSGMIAYVNTSTNKGIAIGPADLNWNSSEGSGKAPVATAISACSGYTRALPSAATTGWRLPSKADFDNMIGSDGCQSADNLRNMQGRQSSPCGVWAMATDEGYWSSTESSSGIYYNLWSNSCTAIADGTNEKYFRPCFSFNVTPSYTVSYNANGGSGSVASQTKWQGTNLTLASSGFTKTGYTLDGWATSAGGDKAYDLGATYTGNAALSLYAHWTPTYTATFADGSGDTGWTIDPTSGVEGTTVTVSYSGENKVKSVTVKGISAVTSAPTANDLTYTGSAQALVTAGTATCGTMVYSLDGETYSAAIPTATNAGNYTVYYKVDGGTDYTGTTAQTVDVTITIPGTIALLKSAINSATNLDYINTNALGKYVTATGTLQSTSAGAVGIITYMSKSAVDTDYSDSRIFVLALTDASTGAKQYISDTPEATYTDRTALNGHQATEHWHSWPSDFPASEAARNYSASLPSGASSWFLPSEGQWTLGGNGSVVSDVMKQTLTAERDYWTSTGNNGAKDNGRVYDYRWSGIGSAQRISLYYVRAAFVY